MAGRFHHGSVRLMEKEFLNLISGMLIDLENGKEIDKNFLSRVLEYMERSLKEKEQLTSDLEHWRYLYIEASTNYTDLLQATGADFD